MGLLRLSGFAGMWPIRDPQALPDNAAIFASNVRTEGGAYIGSLRTPAVIKALDPDTASVYRLPLVSNTEPLDDSYWMEFEDLNTDVVRAPIVNDQYERIYWCSPLTGLKYAPRASIVAGGSGLIAGVIAPTVAPTAEVVAGTGEIVDGENIAPRTTRNYLVTFISEYGEESAPSPAVEEAGHVDQDWLIDNIPQPVADPTRAAVDEIRLYRTVTGLTGVTSWYKVVDLAVGTTFYTDHLSDITVTGNVLLDTASWTPPATGLQGLVAMPNGIFVSWKDNTLYFSENYRPHAWPAEYQITVDFPIVGLAVFGNSCLVCTTGTPAIVTGIKANSLALTKIDKAVPCLSRRSIVPTPEGAFFASDEGLAYVGNAGADIITRDLFSRKQWLDRDPGNFRAIEVSGQYIVSANTTPVQGFLFSPMDPSKHGVSNIAISGGAIDNFGVEPWTGKPWFIKDNALYEWEPAAGVELGYIWVSKEFQTPFPTNFSVMQLYIEGVGSVDVTVEALIRGADGTLGWIEAYDGTVSLSGYELRLASGFRADMWKVTLQGTGKLQSFVMAGSVGELRRV